MKTVVEWAQVAATLFAAVALVFTGTQVLHARRTSALQSLQEFYKAATERERALIDAQRRGDADAQVVAFVEFVNFLEVYSAAENDRLFAGAAREIVRDKLVDSIVVIQEMPAWSAKMRDSISSEITYVNLRRFMTEN